MPNNNDKLDLEIQIEYHCLVRQANYELHRARKEPRVPTIRSLAKRLDLSPNDPHTYMWLADLIDQFGSVRKVDFLAVASHAQAQVFALRHKLRVLDCDDQDQWVVLTHSLEAGLYGYFSTWEDDVALWGDIDQAAVFVKEDAIDLASVLGNGAFVMPLCETSRAAEVLDL